MGKEKKYGEKVQIGKSVRKCFEGGWSFACIVYVKIRTSLRFFISVTQNLFLQTDLRNPKRHGTIQPVSICAIIPCYKPEQMTVGLVRSIIRWNKKIQVCIVDDCTPPEYEKKHKIFNKLGSLSKRVTVLRTPKNSLKAGALNHALRTLTSDPDAIPDVVITLDDDVVINKKTIDELVRVLMADTRVGATCTQCRALNKNQNILTRLQGLEYWGFNAMRIADESFFQGPLVMHGMLTAFRTEVLLGVGFFAEKHLIEDYEITSRIKNAGWRVRLAQNAIAWTQVPDTFGGLWRQRARWINGGLLIVGSKRYWRAIPQDLIGHSVFIAMFALIVIFTLTSRPEVSETWGMLTILIIVISIVQALLLFVFQVWYLRKYVERDRIDWILRITLIPEFIYANTLTLVLLGAYFFRAFERLSNVVPKGGKVERVLVMPVLNLFDKFGYSSGWGTRGV